MIHVNVVVKLLEWLGTASGRKPCGIFCFTTLPKIDFSIPACRLGWKITSQRQVARGTAFQVEIWSILMGLHLAWDRKPNKVSIETDSKEAILFFRNNCDRDNQFWSIHQDVEIVYVQREGNVIADMMAKHGHSLPYGAKVFNEPPTFCNRVIREESLITS
ncbi:putative ribonuclease H protein At1g65750 family [Senna tora]|uniref:Putative ribonuclease H protein At1g65750 family n=1 Tax=Senna tora TaxID=362788 RepID=A0A834X8Y7_9FABA|nr:putative ribonuclease H protein At1g65750 family [Senna tora]